MNERPISQINEVSSQFPHKDLSARRRATRASRPMRIRRFAAAVIAAATLLGVGESVTSPSPVEAESSCSDPSGC